MSYALYFQRVTTYVAIALTFAALHSNQTNQLRASTCFV